MGIASSPLPRRRRRRRRSSLLYELCTIANMSMYFAPAFSSHLLGKCLRHRNPVLQIMEVGIAVLATFSVVWWPYLYSLAVIKEVVKDYKDFEFSDYVRVGRALLLYEIRDSDESIAEMEDVSIPLKGYPEVPAALAVALYVDKHTPLLAENQFTIATLLDPHYTDLSM